MIPSDMNLRIGKVKNYNNKIMVSKPGFSLGTNLNINLNGDDTKVSKTDKPGIKPNKGDKQDVKPVIKPNKEHKQDVKPNRPDIKQNRSKPDTNKITYEEEKAALILGTTAVFTVWWMLK